MLVGTVKRKLKEVWTEWNKKSIGHKMAEKMNSKKKN